MITLSNVAKTYGMDRGVAVAALRDVNLVIYDQDFVVITGRPGSGKTTLLNLMAGLTPPSVGKVLYDGVEVWRLPDREQSVFRNQHVGFVFQFPSLMPSLTVLENVLLPATFLGTVDDAGARTRRAMDLLDQAGLADYMGAYPRQLSAGEQQRAVIARALINQPLVLFADEPTCDLDEPTEREIMALLQHVHRILGVTIVLVTLKRQLADYAARWFEMTNGQVVEAALQQLTV